MSRLQLLKYFSQNTATENIGKEDIIYKASVFMRNIDFIVIVQTNFVVPFPICCLKDGEKASGFSENILLVKKQLCKNVKYFMLSRTFLLDVKLKFYNKDKSCMKRTLYGTFYDFNNTLLFKNIDKIPK